MIFLSGADIVLFDRVTSTGTIVIDGDRIADVLPGTRRGGALDAHVDLQGCTIVPGFIDVHVHGVQGVDALEGAASIRHMAARLPRFGVTAFCPTSIACAPVDLRRLLDGVRLVRAEDAPRSARVLPAHLESNFISPEFKGAQPIECLRIPAGPSPAGEFSGAEILDAIAAARSEVGIVTVASELAGGLNLIRDLVSHGHHVSLGHSGASYDEALEGIDAGARQATHLFNRMTPLTHRAPGLTGAVLERDEITAELICDGVHVHPAMVRVAILAKSPANIMAITDGTAGSGLGRGARASIGGRPITIRDAAYLDDGTLAGSILTMDRAFANFVHVGGLSLIEAAQVCATTPARVLHLKDMGRIAQGAVADLVVMDRDLSVAHTFVGGVRAWSVLGN